jgi:AraC-like DNA-binding protein
MIYQAIIKPEYELLRIENFSFDFPIHFHKRLCIGKVISGEKFIRINNQERTISKNEIFLIPPYIAHSCKSNGNNNYLIFCLKYNGINDLEILSVGAGYLKMDLEKMIKVINRNCNNISIKNKIINYLIQYLEENYNSNIKIDDLANKLGYNKYYILHLFKEEIGISLHQYIIQLRIKRAKQKNGNNNLLNIALENGFFDQSHFIKHFKKYEGITPKEYYKSIIEN